MYQDYLLEGGIGTLRVPQNSPLKNRLYTFYVIALSILVIIQFKEIFITP